MRSVDRSLSILIIDDHRTMLRIIRNLLKQIDLNDVDETTDGNEALKKLHQTSYDLVISDWNMQPMSGLELLREIRAQPSLRRLPFIMITAESGLDRVIAAKQAGVSSYIVKPFTKATLEEKVQKIMQKLAAAA